MVKHVYSTLANDNAYTSYSQAHERAPLKVEKKVLVKGGARLPNSLGHTKAAVVTTVSDEDYEFLKKSPSFRHHVDRGFLRVLEVKADVDTAVNKMEARDVSAPREASDFAGEKGPKPAAVKGKKAKSGEDE